MRILKIGGSFITDKKGYKKAIPENIASMAETVARVWKSGMRDLIVVHGAGSFGHALVLKYGINDGIKDDEDRIGCAQTHAACTELSMMLVDKLIENGVPAVSIPPSALIRQKNRRIKEFRLEAVNEFLGKGFLPVLHGDMVPDDELVGSVCSGDQIMAWLGKDAEFLVFATNVDGVMDDKGNLVPEITKAGFGEVSKHLKESENDVTGAMKGKISELLGINITSYIVNAGKPERIEAILMGKEAPCTKISPGKG